MGRTQINPNSLANLSKPGMTNNPSGRPKCKEYSQAYRKIAGMKARDLVLRPSDSVPMAMAKAQAKQALKGKTPAAKEIVDRAEGPVRHEISGPDGGDIPVTFDGVQEFLKNLVDKIVDGNPSSSR